MLTTLKHLISSRIHASAFCHLKPPTLLLHSGMDYERLNALEWQQVKPDGGRYQYEDNDSEYESEDDIPSTGPHPSYLEPLRTPVQATRPVATQTSQVARSSTIANLEAAQVNVPRGSTDKPHARRLQYKKDTQAEARWRAKKPADGKVLSMRSRPWAEKFQVFSICRHHT